MIEQLAEDAIAELNRVRPLTDDDRDRLKKARRDVEQIRELVRRADGIEKRALEAAADEIRTESAQKKGSRKK